MYQGQELRFRRYVSLLGGHQALNLAGAHPTWDQVLQREASPALPATWALIVKAGSNSVTVLTLFS